MIVECESCQTRFRLDEARVPPTGAKVRCSRCKTAFIVKRPNVSRDERIEEVVAEATDPGAPRAPDTTQDLVDASGPGSPTFSAAGVERSDEEKWEFDEEPRAGGAGAARKPGAAAGSAGDGEGADDLDSLGSPEGWDLLGGAARRVAQEARFEAPSAEPPPPEPERPHKARAPEPASPRSSIESALAAAAAAEVSAPREPRELPGWLSALRDFVQAGVDGGVWIAAVALCTAGLALGLMPRTVASAPPPPALTAAFEGQRVEVSVTTLESAVGGALTVVRGQLPPGSATNQPLRLRAAWVDAKGAPIAGALAIAGPPVGERKLRELSLGRVREEHLAHALELTAGGAFEAVFDALPTGATGISLTREVVPIAAPAVTEEQADATAAATSSRPTARPSSE